MVLKKVPWKYIYITVICQFEKSFEKECDWINSFWPFFPRNFSTPDEDCSKSFHIKTFLRIHRCLTHSDLRKRQKEVYQPIIWLFRQHQIFSFSTQFWNRAKIYFRCQPQALGKNPISELGRERWEAIFQMRGLSIFNFYHWFVFLLTLEIASTF